MIFVLPIVLSTFSSDSYKSKETEPKTENTVINESKKKIDSNHASPYQTIDSSEEIADSILFEQKARADEVQSKVVVLLEAEKYQEAKDLLLKRQEEIVEIMLEIRANENLASSDRERILKPLAVEAESRANQVGAIAGFVQDELLRSLE